MKSGIMLLFNFNLTIYQISKALYNQKNFVLYLLVDKRFCKEEEYIEYTKQ